jgi:eukaryotic-like serine/threonine-protein kinase
VQQRVSLMARVCLVLGVLIQALVRYVGYRAKDTIFAAESDWSADAHLLVLGSAVVIWWRTRSGRRSALELNVLDALLCVLIPAAFSFSVLWRTAPEVRPELLNLIGTGNLVLLRAILIPSSGRHTFLLSAVIGAALVGWTHVYYAYHPAAPRVPPVVHAAMIATWAAMMVIIATLASHTIYGLRERVREASQLGQYTLLRKIGEGGMGVVYEARHALLRRRTAVKLLPAGRAGEENVVRFEREVQLTAELTHPNTIAIYDYGRTPEGVFYYAMEYLHGLDLEVLVEQRGPQQAGVVAYVLEQVCGALAEAHAIGLIHRDIKPANVILCERAGFPGFAKVVDFGLVKRVDGATTNPALSATNAVVGTPLYIAPEAITNPDRVDARSDLYAIGALGYFLLTGTPVFEANTLVEICAHHLHSEPVPPSARIANPVAPEIEALVLECLEKDPERRPRSAAELAARLAKSESRLSFGPGDVERWWQGVRELAGSGKPGQQTPEERLLTVELRKRGAGAARA